MAQDIVAKMQEMIDQALHLDEKNKQHLLSLVQDCDESLLELAEKDPEQARAIALFMASYLHQVIAKEQDPSAIEDAKGILERYYQQRQKEHPKLFLVLQAFCVGLSGFGV